ncbi:MAG: hypothetical protein AB1705_02965 [Verrucomicrobiota bacterium]
MEAIQLIGTNALPAVMKELAATDSPWLRPIISWSNRQTWLPLKYPPAELRSTRAAIACQALGPLAKSAVPVLAKRLNDPSPWVRGRLELAQSLAHAGPEGLAVLIHAFANTNNSVNVCAGICLQQTYLPPDLMRELIALAYDDGIEPRLRATARDTLRVLPRGMPSEQMARVLVFELKDVNGYARQQVAFLIGNLGEYGESALPLIRDALRDPQPEVRVELRNAVLKIEEALKTKSKREGAQ